ncbi:hypothetical protein GCM10020255_004930 [Rhodococcus baikonurensis]
MVGESSPDRIEIPDSVKLNDSGFRPYRRATGPGIGLIDIGPIGATSQPSLLPPSVRVMSSRDLGVMHADGYVQLPDHMKGDVMSTRRHWVLEGPCLMWFRDEISAKQRLMLDNRAYSWLSHRGCDGSVVLVTGGASRPPSVPNRETSKETTYVSGQTGSISTKQPGDGRPLVVGERRAEDLGMSSLADRTILITGAGQDNRNVDWLSD